jgi:YbbR domain-containing protein
MTMPKNIGWKLGSLCAAILLWLAVSVTPDVVTSHSAPVLYRNLIPDLMMTGDSPETIHVELRGTAGVLTAAALADAVAVFDLSGVKSPGERTFTISDTNLTLPPGVTFLRAVPSQFRLRFARLVTIEVPVEIQFTGSLPDGYRLTTRSVSPPTLRIAGSETRVSTVSKVETDSIDLSRLTQSGEFRVDAFAAEPQVRFESPSSVIVKLSIEPSGK